MALKDLLVHLDNGNNAKSRVDIAMELTGKKKHH